MTINIIVKLQVEGIHHWPECPIVEVDFLKYPHRHIFHITCKKQVSHEDRDIEIIQLKRKINDYLIQRFNGNFEKMSCEMIAIHLINKYELCYCSVLEDNENGAEVIR